MRFERLFLIVVLSMLTLIGCTDDGPSQAEFNEAMEGVPSDPSTYELEVVSCVNDGEAIRYTWGLTNLSNTQKTFAFDPYLTNSDGVEEQKERQLVGEAVEPGEYVQWDGFNGGGERFPIGDVECRFEVVDSVLGEFRNEE